MEPPLTAEVVAAFIQSARARRLSAKTIGKHRYHLGFLERAHSVLPTTTEELESFLIGHYEQRRADGRVLSDSTVAKTWSTVRELYCWIEERYPGARNPMTRQVKKPPVGETLPRVLTQQDVDVLLDLNDPDRLRQPHEAPPDARAYALHSLMLDTLGRIGEVAPLTWDNVKVNGDGAEVHFGREGKRGARSAPINPGTLRALRRACPHHALWTKKDGEPLTYWGVHTWFRRTLARAGIKGNAHIMRHTGATLFIVNGGNLFTLMRMGGWRNLTSVQLYVHLANSDIRDQHSRFSTIALRSARGGTQLRMLGVEAG